MNEVLRVQASNLLDFFNTFLGVNFSFTIFIDVLLTAWLIYWVYIFLKKTRAIRILYGFVFLGFIWFFGQALHLSALNYLLKYFVTITAFAIPVVFQPELRSILEKIGRTHLLTDLSFNNEKKDQAEFLESLVDSIWGIKRQGLGALIIFERQTGLRELEENGVSISARLTPQLIWTIFTKGSPLHDGAVLVRNTEIVAASVMIPLADSLPLPSYGMRHRAAISLSSESDALIVVVSEEKKQVSVAMEGTLKKNLSQDELTNILKRELYPEKTKIKTKIFSKKN